MRMKNNWPTTVEELVDECEWLKCRYDLYTLGKRDEPFLGEGEPRIDGTDYLAGEYQYGIAMVPAQWVTHVLSAPAEPDEAIMLKLHGRMNAALLDMQEELLAYHPQDRENASSKELIDCVIRAHQIIEDAAVAGVGTCEGSFHKSGDLSSGRVPLYYCKGTNKSIFMERDARFCPLCGKRIEVDE